jgi:hypothetical protein
MKVATFKQIFLRTAGRALSISTLLMFGMTASYAHHSSSPHFDASKTLTITGVVTNFRFVNPHAWVYLDVVGADGSTEAWNCEFGAASGLRRVGWSEELLKPGTEMTINGIAARRDPFGCSFRSAELVDGTQLARNGEITAGSEIEVASVEEAAVAVVDTENNSFFGTWQTAPRNRRPGGGGGNPAGSGTPTDQAALFASRYGELVTEAGRTASAAYDQRFDDPALQCSPSSIIRGWSEPGGISEVTQSGDQIVIKHEFMDTVRVINMDTREHPSDIEPSMTGHSVGWYEDDVLVVETTGFKAGVLVPHPGLVHSEDMVITERLSLSETGQLTRDYSVVDPQYLAKPVTGTNAWNRTAITLPEYGCVELGGVSNERPD